MDASKIKKIEDEIKSVIDIWVSQTVRDRFINRPVGLPKMSLWDKFKRGVHNWFWGAKGDKYNKHRWTSRFGDELGVSESFDPSIFTLDEYKEIRSVVESLERRLNEVEESTEEKEFGKLRLMNLIRSAADDLKGMLISAIRRVAMDSPPQHIAPVAEMPSQPAPKSSQSAKRRSSPVTTPSSQKRSGKQSSSSRGQLSSNSKKTKSASDIEKKSHSSSVAIPEIERSGESDNSNLDARDSSYSDQNQKSTRTEPSTQPKSQTDEKHEDSETYHEELRRFFYTKKDDPVDFAKTIIGFLSIEKYKEHKKELVKFWNSLLAERTKSAWSEEETRTQWYRGMVLSNRFLSDISKATGYSAEDVKKDMIKYLSTLDS